LQFGQIHKRDQAHYAGRGGRQLQWNGTSYFPYLSADGEFVTFTSDASDLVDGDTNGQTDVFVAPTGFANDTTSPTLAISASDASGNNNGEFTLGEALTLTFDFSEEVNGFDAGDITLSGGTLVTGSFVQNATDPTLYTVQATFSRPGSVTVADGVYADLAGQDGTGDSLALAT
jgi:hypothetical protein